MKKYLNKFMVVFLVAVALQACSTYVPDATKQVAIAQAKAACIKNANPGYGAEGVKYVFASADYTAAEDSGSGLPEVRLEVNTYYSNYAPSYSIAIMAQDKNGKWSCIGGGRIIGNEKGSKRGQAKKGPA